jgi:Tol biopolymer transport system component
VIYNSTNPKAPGIWKIRPDGSDAILLVPGTWSTPEVSPDGAWVVMRTGTVPRTVRIAGVADGALQPFPIDLPGDDRLGRPRWTPDGKSIVFTAGDRSGNHGLLIQDFLPGRDTSATRRPLIGFDADLVVESFGISPDGARVVYSVSEEINSLMLAEGLPGIEPPRRK